MVTVADPKMRFCQVLAGCKVGLRHSTSLGKVLDLPEMFLSGMMRLKRALASLLVVGSNKVAASKVMSINVYATSRAAQNDVLTLTKTRVS